MTATTMKAVRFHQFGGPEVLVYEDMPRPDAGEGEVLIKVRTASVNPIDWKVRAGMVQQRIPVTLPLVVGRDVAGVVEAVGAGVSAFKAGDEVMGQTAMGKHGSFAEFTVAPVKDLVKKPAALSFSIAAALPIAGAAAWHSIYEAAEVKPGQTVLVQGAAGGVGMLVVQLAKRAGATVVATCSGRNVDMVKSLGADRVIDYTKERFEDSVKDVDAVIDCVLGEVQTRSWAVVKKGGILVSLSGPPSEELAKQHQARGAMTMGAKGMAHLGEMADLAAEGKLKVIIGSELPLSATTEAHEISQAGHARGKIVVVVS